MLKAAGLTKRFEDGRLAVNRLELTVGEGEVFGLLGPNGAGKTTTINLFLDFIRPTSGGAFVNGVEVAKEPRKAKRFVALIPENVALYPTLSAARNVEFFAGLAARVKPSRDDVLSALQRVGLPEDAADRRVAELSKGMRQKVGIAIALVQRAPAVLLDEPTSGLDPKAAAEFVELLDQLRSTGAAVLMATHDVFRARRICDRVGMMRDGELSVVLEHDELRDTDLERVYLKTML